MIIGTHNSMTYLPPKKWWGYLLIPFWRCQSKTFEEQWNAGVRCFDLRITFENDGTPVFAHGIVKLNEHAGMTLYDITSHARKSGQKVYIRVVCEDLKASDEIAEKFESLCELLNKIDCVVPFEGRRKGDWNNYMVLRTNRN